jgi:hypothetical protein
MRRDSARASNPILNQFQNSDRVALLRREIALAPPNAIPIQLLIQLGLDLLYAGDTEAAIKAYDTIETSRAQNPAAFGEKFLLELRHLQAVAHLRLGEQDNCQAGHNADSCIFPIAGGGVHRLQRGSRKAIEILETQLMLTPDDAAGVWLLNLAYMTLGEYPDKVPVQWRIPPHFFRSEHDLKRFRDVAGDLGLDVDDHAGGAIAEDFDADGDLDLLLSNWTQRGAMHYFGNNGDGTFSNRTAQAGLDVLVGGLHMVQGDYNNDGLPDVLILRGAWLESEGRLPDSLLRNEGHGRFSDVTEEAGLLAFHPGQTAVWFDYNGDGWLDLFFGYESTGTNAHPCRLYRNNRDGTFTECAVESGVARVSFVKAAASGDYDNDGRPDLYLSMRNQPNVLLRNEGPRGDSRAWSFKDVTQTAGVAEPRHSFSSWFFDYDNDGWEDLFVCGYSIESVGDILNDYRGRPHQGERPRLYRNNRDGTFKDVTKEMGLFRVAHGMGSNYGDFDNDGWLDIYLGTGDPLIPNLAFRNAGGVKFQDVTASSGLGHLQKGHGVAFADFDQDGDLDIYHSVGGAYEGDNYRNALFENPGHDNNWLLLKLEGERSNRPGLGARVKLIVQTQPGKTREVHRTVSTGSSFGANPFRQMIGLGSATNVLSLQVHWPATGKTQTFTGVQPNKFYRVRESATSLSELPYAALPFVARKHAAQHSSGPAALHRH